MTSFYERCARCSYSQREIRSVSCLVLSLGGQGGIIGDIPKLGFLSKICGPIGIKRWVCKTVISHTPPKEGKRTDAAALISGHYIFFDCVLRCDEE